MGALLTVHETIAIDTQKQCSLLYRALLYYGKNKNSSNDIADSTIPSAVRPQRGRTMVARLCRFRSEAEKEPRVLTCGVRHPHGYDPRGVAQQE